MNTQCSDNRELCCIKTRIFISKINDMVKNENFRNILKKLNYYKNMITKEVVRK